MTRARGKIAIAAAATAALGLSACGDQIVFGDRETFPDNVDAAPAPAEPDIDLDQYALTFEDEFRRRFDVSGADCNTRWIAHTPWRGDFGAAAFTDPEKSFPFKTRNGLLRIEARKTEEGNWQSGLLSSWNTCGEGFAQKYGYFEIRAMLPPGDGFWPAFWLIGVDRSRFTSEVDVIEHHGVKPGQYTMTLHVHPRTEGVSRVLNGHVEKIEPDLLYRGFNSFGVSIEEDETVFYLNHKEIWRTDTGEHFKQPHYMLLNLAMDAGEISARTPERAFMYVDYVRAYEKRND